MDIVPLDPSHVDDYLALFDTAFTDNPRWAGCYCAYYDDPCPDAEWAEDASAGAAHRALKARRITDRRAQGLLAFVDGRAIGWCNAGPRASFVNLRAYSAAIADPDEAVGCVMCFVIHPEHRRHGVASGLLAAVDRYFRSLGLTVAEAYPRAQSPADPSIPWTAAFYKGSIAMYEQAGYMQVGLLDGFAVMRKTLA